ncbi:MAG: S-layer homology domain-containing protein [Clostridiales bacterium]|nr:S-layer homology domain-containing protein [Clostridiales bacterium]
MKKKFFAMLMAVVMVMAMLPAAAFADAAPALPTATVTELDAEDLTFALKFVADDVTEEQKEYYGSWIADYVLTVNKDVTFAKEGGDGYLSGQYGEYEWIDVPAEGSVAVSAGEPVLIMEELTKGIEGAQDLTYNDVLTFVQEFNCGVYFTEEFLAENRDLKVTLELKLYNPAAETESHTIGEAKVFSVALPTATVTDLDEASLTYALKFVADEATAAQKAVYGSWIADYVLTVNKDVTFGLGEDADGYLSGQYGEYEWIEVPAEGDVAVTAGEPVLIMEALTAGIEGAQDLTYNDVLTFVQEFNCGVFFTEEFLAENRDLEVTLELKLYNPEDASESYTIGEAYTFSGLPTATVTEITVTDPELTFALKFVADEPTAMQKEAYGSWIADYVLTVNQDVTFAADGSGDGYLAGQYTNYSEDWVLVPLEGNNIEVKANQSINIMGKMTEGIPGAVDVTYNDILTFVQEFNCGAFFSEEYLDSLTSDLVVTLELKVYNPEDETESYTVGDVKTFTVEFEAPYVPEPTPTPAPVAPTPSTEVKDNEDGTFTVTSTSTTPVEVVVPVEDVAAAGPGTVVVVVNPDGTETVLMDSVLTDEGVKAAVAAGAVVKVVDNSTDFEDVAEDNWAEDAIDFVSARELMNGVGEETFAPEATTSRAMVWTILARLAGVDLTVAEGEDWYAAAQKWAIENGISDGTNAEEEITREQLATMLWRFAGEPASDHDISDFADHEETSDWALEAKKWANENGIINGHADGTLDPQGDATRAQTAQVLMNYLLAK